MIISILKLDILTCTSSTSSSIKRLFDLRGLMIGLCSHYTDSYLFMSIHVDLKLESVITDTFQLRGLRGLQSTCL
jgi:hypothetical protein